MSLPSARLVQEASAGGWNRKAGVDQTRKLVWDRALLPGRRAQPGRFGGKWQNDSLECSGQKPAELGSENREEYPSPHKRQAPNPGTTKASS
jgi:hypothetical protein